MRYLIEIENAVSVLESFIVEAESATKAAQPYITQKVQQTGRGGTSLNENDRFCWNSGGTNYIAVSAKRLP